MDATKLTLTTPEPKPTRTVTEWRVVLLGIERAYDGSTARISVIAENNLGERAEATYGRPPNPGDEDYLAAKDARLFLTALNTANLSIKSLHVRLLEKLAADGLIGAGTVA